MSSEAFSVHIEEVDGTLRGTLTGELDMLTEPDLVEAFGRALENTAATNSVLDLRQLGFMDSSGLRAVMLCRQQAEGRGIGFSLVVEQGPVTRLLDLAGLRSWFSYDRASEL